MRSNGREGIVAVFDALSADLDRALELDVDALTPREPAARGSQGVMPTSPVRKIRVDDELWEATQSHAAAEGRTVSAAIRERPER